MKIRLSRKELNLAMGMRRLLSVIIILIIGCADCDNTIDGSVPILCNGGSMITGKTFTILLALVVAFANKLRS